jgi:hypothetical protein
MNKLPIALGLGEQMYSRKNRSMQADIHFKQSMFPGMCPICNAPLSSTGPSTSPNSVVMCPSCGFSGPFVQRQHQLTPQPDQQPHQGVPSVWIDPAVSTFLLDDQKKRVDYTPGVLQLRSRHRPKKPQSISSSSAKGPVTPIPPRASARRSNNVRVRPKYLDPGAQVNQLQENDITRIPTYTPSTVWQYESSDFEIESSLPALSLLVDAPTLSESYAPRLTDRLPYIDEIDTIPFQQENRVTIDEINTMPLRLRSQQLDIDEIDTLPPLAGSAPNGRSLVSNNQPATMALALASPDLSSTQSSLFEREKFALAQQITDPSSWTAGSASGSPYAQRIAERHTRTRRRLFPHPMDHLRWWLLHPGRIEFILWLCGTILLLGVTIVLLLATAISLSWVSPGFQNGTTPTLNSSSTSAATVVTNGSMTLSLLNTGPLVPGGVLYLQGQGFSPNGNVVFTGENKHPMLRQDSQTNSLMTDGQGNFSVILKEGSWKTGRHHIIALDVVTGRALDFPVTLTAGPFGKNVTATPPSSSPGLTATATSPGGPGAFPTAVGSTPVPKPTVGTTPPVPTSTRQPSPTPTATSGITPIATPGSTPTTGTTPPASSSSLNGGSNFLLASAAASIGRSADLPHSSLNPLGSWSWLLMSGYILAMFMLGFAGVLRKKHKN